MSENRTKDSVYVGKPLRVFISYSSKDKRYAGAIKRAFQHFGMEVFLAHEDIATGAQWQKRILYNLNQADIFVPVLSKNFCTSVFTDQETGFAISRGLLILPIALDGTKPYGFLSSIQALTKFEYHVSPWGFGYKDKVIDCTPCVFELTKTIAEKEDLRDNLVDSLIRSLLNMRSFREAEKVMNFLSTLDPFSDEQLNELFTQSERNSQVHDAHGCQSLLRELYQRYQISLQNKEYPLLIAKGIIDC